MAREDRRIFLVLAVITVSLFLLGVLVLLIPDKGGDFVGSSLGLHGTLAVGLIGLSFVLLIFTLVYGLVSWLSRERPNRPAAEDALRWAQEHNFDLTYAGIKITPEQNQILQGEISSNIQNRQNLGQLQARLADAFGEQPAKMIAATELTRAYIEGNLMAWRSTGLVEGKRWETAADEWVCPICGPLHGVEVAIDAEFGDGFDGPPAHPGCRCWVQPITKVK